MNQEHVISGKVKVRGETLECTLLGYLLSLHSLREKKVNKRKIGESLTT